jgi:hypothetical protein
MRSEEMCCWRLRLTRSSTGLNLYANLGGTYVLLGRNEVPTNLANGAQEEEFQTKW